MPTATTEHGLHIGGETVEPASAEGAWGKTPGTERSRLLHALAGGHRIASKIKSGTVGTRPTNPFGL